MSVSSPQRITLAQIADQVGVSLATVSKVLNDRPDVAEDTRAKVQAELDVHGYRKRRNRTHSAGLIEVVFHRMNIEYSLEILRGVEDVAKTRGWSVVVTEAGSRLAPGRDWFRSVLQRRPVGVILVFSTLDDQMRDSLRSRDIPVVVLDPAGDPPPDLPSVGATNWAGGVAATRHLLDLGHTDIAMISGPTDLMCSHARVDGFRSAMETAGVPVVDEWVRWGDFDIDGGRTHGHALLTGSAGKRRPTAIFAGSDLQAIGVMEAAREAGVRVPEQLSIVGFDDIPISRYVTPALTTVHQPIRLMAQHAAELIAEPAQSPMPVPRMDLATTLVERDSTAAPGR